MLEVINATWYTPWTGNLEVIGIVKITNGFEEKYYIGTAKGDNEQEDIKQIIKFGARFYPETFKEEQK